MHIPRAPALGLLLEQPQFGSYNTRVEDSNAEIRRRTASKVTEGAEDDGEASKAHDDSTTLKHKIDFERHRQLVDEFKRDCIYAAMRAEEGQNRM